MSSPGMVFIVGMERCFTTSLAQWLVDAGLCDGFVEGIKEPAMFSGDPSRALARWERERGRHDRWLLDAWVAYECSDAALDTIATLPDYRVVLCLRDQFARMVSAYRLYRALYGLSVADALEHPVSVYKFGDEATRARLREDPLAPAAFRAGVECRRVYTLIRYTEAPEELSSREQVENYDSAFDRLKGQALPVRIVHKWARWTKAGAFPPLSVLGNSCYFAALSRVLARLDPARIALATLAAPQSHARLGPALGCFLGSGGRDRGVEPSAPVRPVGLRHPAARHRSRARARDGRVRAGHARAAGAVERTPGLDVSLFTPDALFHAS